MNATPPQARRTDMGTIATIILLGTIFALFALAIVELTAQSAQLARQRGGHLPWPLVQWALSTPVAVLALVLAGGVFVIIPANMFGLRIAFRRHIARAIDATDMPTDVQLIHAAQPDESRRERWLGRGRRTQLISLALLVSAISLVLVLLTGIDASIAHRWDSAATIERMCKLYGCPPNYPVVAIGSGILILGNSIGFILSFWWKPHMEARIEARCGIRFRFRVLDANMRVPKRVYVREPGVTPEAAAAALAHFAPAGGVPTARVIAAFLVGVLAPVALLLWAEVFLPAWLQTQWIPG